MKKILVPCDFSPAAQQAYTFALDIAKKTDGEVYVLHVIDLPFLEDALMEVPVHLNPEQWKQLEDEARSRFKKIKASHTRQNDVTFRVAHGPVTSAILDFIVESKIDLVVMGTKGHNDFEEYLLGSNSEKIVRFARVPVFVIRRAVNLSSIKSIAVPTTLNLNENAFISHLKKLQEFFGAELHLLVVNTPHNMLRSHDQIEKMQEYVKHYQITKYTLNTRNGYSEEDEIRSFVKEKSADMIAIATHGRRGLARLFAGSITEDLVHDVECPIWTYSLRR